MCLMLGWSSMWGQSRDRRDTHCIAVAELLDQGLDGGQLGDPGSLHSFWCPVYGKGAEKELCETQAAFSLSCQPREHFQAASKQPGATWQSSGEQRQWWGQGWAGVGWTQVGKAAPPALPAQELPAATGAPLPSLEHPP